MDVVSQVLSTRGGDTAGIERMVAVSLIGHALLVAAAIVVPSIWPASARQEAPQTVMTISLGGPEGPRTSMTTLGGRPIQQVVESPKAVEPVRPPAAREPEMIEPKKAAPKKTETKTQTAVQQPKGRTPTKGEEQREGSAPSAQRSDRGQGFGLSAGGGDGTQGYLDVSNFCCPEYLRTMLDLIRSNWDRNQVVRGTTLVKFTVLRDGTISAVEVEKSSGNAGLDLFSRRALLVTRKIPPLPAAFPDQTLTVHLYFEY